MQRGLKKLLRVNADPKMDTGDSHAPVPFYVTTAGYGVLVDTARYVTIYAGNKQRKGTRPPANEAIAPAGLDPLSAAYRQYRFQDATEVLVEIPVAEGVDVYVFAWALRCAKPCSATTSSRRRSAASALGLGHVVSREEPTTGRRTSSSSPPNSATSRMPCDVIGLEPGWQTARIPAPLFGARHILDPAKLVTDLVGAVVSA